MEDWQVRDDDGDESLATGPLAAADCAFGAGLEEMSVVQQVCL